MKQHSRFPGSGSSVGKRGLNVALHAALGLGLGAAVLASEGRASAQVSGEAFPFPSANVRGNNAFVTSVLTTREIQADYQRWVSTVIAPCGNRRRIVYFENDDQRTVSEGVGYGMVISAYMGDRTTFDGLWQYYQSHAPSGLMDWYIRGCDDVVDTGSASDADVDAAFGLIIADRQWGGYQEDAAQLLGQIQNQLFEPGCNGIMVGGSAGGFGTCGCINPSYLPPGYYRAFAQYGNAGFWTGARDATYTFLQNAQANSARELVPAWSNSNGGGQLAGSCIPQVAGGGQANEFQADAARTPWRVATDLLWTGDPRARGVLTPIAEFATSQRPIHLVDRYRLDGTPLATQEAGGGALNIATLDADTRRSTFMAGGLTTALMATSQVDLDRYTGAWRSMYVPGDTVGGLYRTYNNSLSLLYGLVLTGTAWDPVGDADPTALTVPPPTPAVPDNLIRNGSFDAGVLQWSTGVFGGTASEGFAIHENGEMHLTVQRNEADAPFNLQFFQPVALQAGQNYVMSVRAKASTPRRLRMLVALNEPDYTTYGAMNDGEVPMEASFGIDTEMKTYEIVFQSPATDSAARFAFQFGDDDAEIILDDVVLAPTDRPVTPLSTLAEPDPTDPATPTDPANPPAGGNNGGGTPDNGGLGQVVPDTGDSSPTGPIGSPPPSGSGQGPTSEGLPPPPAGRPPGDGTCTVDADCGEFLCSGVLGICYEPELGYVWDSSRDDWSRPPKPDFCAPYEYWPKINACYEPESGWAYNQTAAMWQYYGDWYTEGQDPVSDSGCAVGRAPGQSGAPGGLLMLGLLGAAVGLSRRRFR